MVLHLHIDLIHQFQIIGGKALAGTTYHKGVAAKEPLLHLCPDLFLRVVNVAQHRYLTDRKIAEKPHHGTDQSQGDPCTQNLFQAEFLQLSG